MKASGNPQLFVNPKVRGRKARGRVLERREGEQASSTLSSEGKVVPLEAVFVLKESELMRYWDLNHHHRGRIYMALSPQASSHIAVALLSL